MGNIYDSYGFLTLLAQDPTGGLQIRSKTGSWIDIAPRDDALVINVGDALSLMTGGRFASTPHRVINPSHTRDRYSIAMFFDPNLDAEVGCLTGFDSGDDTSAATARLQASYGV